MEWWEIAILATAVTLLVLLLIALFVWHRLSKQTRAIGGRIQALSWRGRYGLAASLARDERIPPGVRLVIPTLVLYLALPLDIIPDFIPVLGQIDDIVVLLVGGGLMLRFMPRGVLEEHLSALEAREPGGRRR